jgi:hypothetical protein
MMRGVLVLWLAALPALPQVPAELAEELKRLQAQAPEMTKPGVAISDRKQYADRILKLREMLELAPVKPVLLLTSASLDGSGISKGPVTVFSNQQEGEWRLKPFAPGAFFSDQSTQTAWRMESTLALPKQIALGEDFTIGVCGTATLQNKGGTAPRAADRLQLSTEISVSPGSNYARSYQQFSLPPAPGQEVLQAQVSQILFRFDAASSKPPSSYVYRAEARQAGEDQNESRLMNPNGVRRFNPGPPAGLVFTFGARVEQGLLGTDTTIDAPPAAFTVRIEQAMFYGLTTPDSGMITLHESSFRTWDLVYRVPKAGETVATLNPAPPAACQARGIGGVVAPVSAVPPAPGPVQANASPNAAVVIADLRGRPAGEAASVLRDAGLVVRPRIGAAAPSATAANTVASLAPSPGTAVQRGSAVELVLHGPYAAPATRASVPLLEGLSAAEAKAAVERAGLKIRPAIGPAAASVEAVNRVQSQSPAAGTSLAQGTEVNVVVFGPVQTARVRTAPKILPPPPLRTFACPAPAGQWSIASPQATSARFEKMSFQCFYRHPQLPPAYVYITYLERGYGRREDACPSDAKANAFITSSASVDTRGMSPEQERSLLMFYWGSISINSESPARAELDRNVVNVVLPGLLAQVAPIAEPCNAPPPPILNCEDNALCAVHCPVIQGVAAKQPVVSPRSIWSNDGHMILSTCGAYTFQRGYTTIYAEVDADPSQANRATSKGKCGTGLITQRFANAGITRTAADLAIISKNQRVEVRASNVPLDNTAAAGQAIMDIFNQLEPRSFLTCIP